MKAYCGTVLRDLSGGTVSCAAVGCEWCCVSGAAVSCVAVSGDVNKLSGAAVNCEWCGCEWWLPGCEW